VSESIIDSSPTYDANGFGYSLAIGAVSPDSPLTLNVASGKKFDGITINITNSGQGKLFGLGFTLEASGSSQDATEPVRGVVGRVTNSGTGNSKTTAVRVGASSSGSNASILAGVDADVTVTSSTNVNSFVYGVTVAGTTDARASGILFFDGGVKYLLGVGSTGAIKWDAAVYRAWMATGSTSGARMFQGLNNAGSERFYIDNDGNTLTQALTVQGDCALTIVRVTGAGITTGASRLTLDQPSSTNSRIAALGPDGSTNGILDVYSYRSDGSNGVLVASLRASGLDIPSIAAPGAPASSTARVYVDTSGGKVRLMVRFPTGAAQQIAIEP